MRMTTSVVVIAAMVALAVGYAAGGAAWHFGIGCAVTAVVMKCWEAYWFNYVLLPMVGDEVSKMVQENLQRPLSA